ncbi:beta-1,4-galactosyltransferase 4 [Thalassophryne amazonica]|uniref:beta-1,4-galactosyltransferase 4 n=1 Tax=Thalassophryne amazonica TaxID=390379 RepID=UPI00147158C9|nr:beta-1,4-galactosyltransferase 4 [Thalassophryne amazonica]
MGYCLSLWKTLRRGKYFLLLLLCLSVVAWIAIFSSETVKSQRVFSTTMQTFRKGDVWGNISFWSSLTDCSTSSPVKVDCPEESPLLQGAMKLAFDPSLTLKDVELENKAVTEGQYKPPDCTARQSIAILIPFRNREKHLLYLLHHLHPFLQRQQRHYAIYVIQQAGDATFNRAKLLNVGFLEAQKDYSWGCFIFHDVDLVPENDHNLYKCDKYPRHLVVGRNSTGYKLRYRGYFGGVTALSKDQFDQVNGFSNSYWGWGGEDDDLRVRVELQKMKIIRPPDEVARYTMVFHKRDSGNKINGNRMKMLRQTAQVWRKDGLSSCSYKVLSLERSILYVNVTVDIGEPQLS